MENAIDAPTTASNAILLTNALAVTVLYPSLMADAF